MNAPLVFLLTFFLTATAIPISDGTTDSSIVTPADFASADVTPTDFNPADVALADVPSVASGDDTSIGSASTESTGVDSESVASNPGCATTSQTQGFLQPGGDISTDISPTTHASLAVAVQDGFCPNPNQSPGSGNNPNNDEEKNPSGRRRQYKELEELKRKLCCKLEPKESVNFVAYGKTYPVINYGVCHECMFQAFHNFKFGISTRF